MVGPAGIHRSMPIEKMEPIALEKFITPKGLKQRIQRKGIFSSFGIVLKYLNEMIVAKFNQIRHQLSTGDHITNKSIRESIKANIKVLRKAEDLEAHPLIDQNDLDASINKRTWMHHSISQMRHLCNHMLEKGANEEKIKSIIEDLDILDKVNDTQGKIEVDTFKRYQQAEIEGAGKPIMLQRKQALAKEVFSLISLAKETPIKIDHESTGAYTSVDPYITVSLGQSWGKRSTDNKKLDKIEEAARNNFEGIDYQTIKEEINTLIELLNKGFTQEINAKVEMRDVLGYKHHIRINIPRSEEFSPEVQHLEEAIESLQKITLTRLGSD